MRAWILLVSFALAACGDPQPTGAESPDAASPSPTATGTTSPPPLVDGAVPPPASDAALAVDAAPPADLGTTDGTVAAGWYCGSNGALMQHLATWNAPTLKNPNNLFHVGASSDKVDIVGYCTNGCTQGSAGHDHCKAPDGAPTSGKECWNGAGKYCGHGLGIEARSYPDVPASNKEGLFDCTGQTDVTQVTNCDCEVNPAGADACGGPRKLWIAYETGTTTCVTELTDFWDCLFNHTDYESFVDAYGTGYKVAWGGIAEVPQSCGIDYSCAANAAHFAVGALDVVLIVTPGGVGGMNDWTPSVTINGKTIPIHGAHIGDASGNCNMQTAYSMHEVYEATSDPGAGDCCDGEVPYAPAGTSGCLAWNSGCSIACQKWGPTSCGGDGSFGLSTIQCPHGSYTYQRVSPASDEYGFTQNACLPINVTH